ncbi:hypothetical protein jhhlp_008239 [Lomentospora prolificans]|uniref:Uncharacterized protein n=1 Tax=Lomentospora prolificans TaxID=41688 RepID=A0A2N3MXH6_9PEZI|nr:hypothetical protein jhhlp_008239 [Lomentospora prolificans]
MYYANEPVVWRKPIAAQLISIIAQVALVMIPESPRRLLKPTVESPTDGHHHKAIDNLAQLKGTDTLRDDTVVLNKKAEIDQVLSVKQANGPMRMNQQRTSQDSSAIPFSYLCVNPTLALLDKANTRYAGVQIMQQLSGINRLVYYFPHILTSDLGQSHKTAFHLAARLAVTYSVFSLIP